MLVMRYILFLLYFVFIFSYAHQMLAGHCCSKKMTSEQPTNMEPTSSQSSTGKQTFGYLDGTEIIEDISANLTQLLPKDQEEKKQAIGKLYGLIAGKSVEEATQLILAVHEKDEQKGRELLEALRITQQAKNDYLEQAKEQKK